jgi:predicted RNase H-like HicB family nuclease
MIAKGGIMQICYPACFYPDDETPGYAVEVPDLPGCCSSGADLAKAILMGIEAAGGWIISYLEDGKPVPPPSPIEAIQPEEGRGGFASMILLDLDEHVRKFGKQPTRAEIEIPAYLKTFAEEHQINISAAIESLLFAAHHEYHFGNEEDNDEDEAESQAEAAPQMAAANS